MTTPTTQPVSLRVYVATYAGLLALATLSLLLSALPEATAFTVSMFIAAIKSVVVLLFFMHLIEERFSYRFVMIVSAALVCILITLTTLDPMTRAPYPPAPSHNAAFRAGGR